jgi:DNA-binding NtrC family response regulator
MRNHRLRLSGADDPVPALVGRAPAMLALKNELIRVAADPEVTVLIEGESGTGKELVARAIHQHSSRAAEPFVVVNLAGLSPELIESELFGHIRGAFTGAIADRIGPFERAHRGAIFLDEIGELPRELQAKLLRVLQERRVQRVGSHVETPFDARVIAATNRRLWREVRDGRFREDLYYRLRVFELRIPPLRDRGADELALLVAHFLRRLCERRGRPVPRVSEEVMARLASHSWPGNVRELENVVERALVAAAGDPIVLRHLPRLTALRPRSSIAHRSRRVTPEQISRSLHRHQYNKSRAAAALGISRYRLRREMLKHGIPSRPAATGDQEKD